jgi:hypothetical protein
MLTMRSNLPDPIVPTANGFHRFDLPLNDGSPAAHLPRNGQDGFSVQRQSLYAPLSAVVDFRSAQHLTQGFRLP